MNPLLNKEFLKQLDDFNNREIYARITALDINEYPLELIEGKITGGNINIDGASALRRTCSVSMVAEDVKLNDFYWGLNTKFKLEVGLKNTIDPDYPEIIWFPQGIYIITSFSSSLSASSYSISINGKDKMCRLNGEFGGALPASIDFGTEDIYDNNTGILTREKLPIKRIIREMIHTYAEEPYHNIIINDLDKYGLELLEYRGNAPMYMLYDTINSEYNQMLFNGKMICYDTNGTQWTLETIPKYNVRIDLIHDEATRIKLEGSETIYTVSKIVYGETAGYRLTDLTYAGDLISNPGESITSILDKIIGMLGNFEYFYDLDGRFIFQEKKTYLNASWNPIVKIENETYVENAAFVDKASYSFGSNNLIKSLSNTPNLGNVKNDFVIWGSRKGVSGAEIPIHMRFAIHKKPERYTTYEDKTYTTEDLDWREIIYQMAIDYYKHNQKDDFLSKIAQNNPEYSTGFTGYESFYIDLQAFWRELYNPDVKDEFLPFEYDYDNGDKIDTDKELYIKEGYVKTDKTENAFVWMDGKFVQYNKDKPELQGKQLYIKTKLAEASVPDDIYKDGNKYKKYLIETKIGTDDKEYDNKVYIEYFYSGKKYYIDDEPKDELRYWNKIVQDSPDLLNFWIDFLDTDETGQSELSKMSIFAIGNRPKVVNDKNVKSIYFRNVPNVIYGDKENITLEVYDEKSGYVHINIPEGAFQEDCFTISAQGKSAKDQLNELLYQHSYCTESVNIQAIPVYYLEPNTIVSIEDKNTNISGEYILSKITIPLTYNGMMSIQATKSPQRIY